MEHLVEHTFDAPIAMVWDMISDADAQVAMFEAMGYREVEVIDQRLDADTFRIVTRRVLDLELPGFARRVLHPSNTMHSTDVWERGADGGATGVLSMKVDGAPVTISGNATIAPDGDSTSYSVAIGVDVRVPIVGRRIAQWAMRDVDRQFDQQFDVAQDWLSAHGS